MANDIRRLKKSLKKSGWTNPKGHLWLCPCGNHKLTIHTTVSDVRAIRNLERDMRSCPYAVTLLGMKGKTNVNRNSKTTPATQKRSSNAPASNQRGRSYARPAYA